MQNLWEDFRKELMTTKPKEEKAIIKRFREKFEGANLTRSITLSSEAIKPLEQFLLSELRLIAEENYRKGSAYKGKAVREAYMRGAEEAYKRGVEEERQRILALKFPEVFAKKILCPQA